MVGQAEVSDTLILSLVTAVLQTEADGVLVGQLIHAACVIVPVDIGPRDAQGEWSFESFRSHGPDIFLAAVNEADFGMSRSIRNKVAAVLSPKVTAYKQSGMSRTTMVNNLLVDMELAIRAGIDDYVSPTDDESEEDDRVGGVQEVLFGADSLQAAQSGTTVRRHLNFEGSGSRYTLTFQLQ